MFGWRRRAASRASAETARCPAGGLLGQDDLDGHGPVEGDLPREVDGSHTAPPQEPLTS